MSELTVLENICPARDDSVTGCVHQPWELAIKKGTTHFHKGGAWPHHCAHNVGPS